MWKQLKPALSLVGMALSEEFKRTRGYKVMTFLVLLSTPITYVGLFFTLQIPLPKLPWQVWAVLSVLTTILLLMLIFVAVYRYHMRTVEELNASHKAETDGLRKNLDTELTTLTTQHEKHTATLQTKIASLQSELNEFIPKLKFVVERNPQCRVTLRHEEYLFDPPDGEPKEVDYYVVNANVKIHFENDAAITLTLRKRMWVSLFRRTGRGKEKEIPLDPEKESLLMLAGEGSDVTPKLEDFVFEPLKRTKSYALFCGMGISTRYGKRLNRNCFMRLTMDAMGQLPCYVDLDVDWEAAKTEKGSVMTPRTSARCQAHK